MATQEKLVKSLETLQQILNSSLSFEPARKKEKISLCTFITEALSNPSIRVAPNFGSLLSWSIQVLLQVCGDSESDVCLVGDECLNRLIRATIDAHASKIQIELHKKIKENSDAKSLRAALWRFAELAHLIRPNKGKPYVANFLPVLCKVIERQEELIHETLGNYMVKIMTALGNFMTDADVKTLLKGFLNNMQSTSPVLRRTVANCILPICLHCKNSNYFFIFTFNTLINALVPIEESHTSALIIGVMGCLKQLIPHLNNPKYDTELKGSFGVTKESSEVAVAAEKYIQVYELCLYYLTNSDHNIINASLETLNNLLQYCPPECKDVLLSPFGISKSFLIFDSNSRLKFKSPSSLSVTTTLSGDDLLNSESDLLDSVRPDIEKWIDDSKLSVININYADTSSQLPIKNVIVDRVDYDIANFDGGSECASSFAETESSDFIKPDFVVGNTDKLVLSEKSSEKSCSFQDTRSIDTYHALQDVYIGSFHDKGVPLLYSIRLLSKYFLLSGKQGNLIPDKNMRVSVKSLALTCLSTIAKLYPEGFLQSLDKSEDGGTENQFISDILLYSDHSDPQLRGSVRIFVANFIETVLVNSGNNYKDWVSKNCVYTEGQAFDIKNLVSILVKGLQDESSTCVRQTVTGLEEVLHKLLQSRKNQKALPILHALPFVVNNPYWLVKVKLLKVLSCLCYTTIYYITGSSHFQNKILHSVLFEMLKDDDPRVRKTCSKAIVKVIPYLYFPQDNYNVDHAVYKAKQFKKEQVSEMVRDENDISPIRKRFIAELVFPFNKINEEFCEEVGQGLSRVVTGLKEIMLASKSKYFIYGCIETLRRLSISYPPTIYATYWGCFESFLLERDKPGLQNGFDLYNICVTLLTSSSLTYDISCHINLLEFAGNIFAGVALANLKPKVNLDVEDNNLQWDMFEDRNLAAITEQFMDHTIRLLNIFVHVIENITPTVPQSKPILASLPPSPIKKRKNDAIEKVKLLSPIKISDKEDKGEKKGETKINSATAFAFLPHYVKLYEVLKTAYTNYKITLDFGNSGMFIELLKIALNTLSLILEIGSLHESGPVAEDLLTLLQTVFVLTPPNSVECVQQLLKSLFGANLTFTISNLDDYNKHNEVEVDSTFYHNIFQKPYNEMATFLEKIRGSDKAKKNDDNTVMGYLHRKILTTSRSSEKVLASYIKLFEPMVIKSLQVYRITSDVLLQCKVLKLLCQLVQLKINYCLLDSEQIFIAFVIKQFEFIEEGQIHLPEEIIPRIFDFLVHLSYAKQHSKMIIDIPKIIQLCDGLMASGQPPLNYCIAALKPVVQDIFLLRNKSNITDYKELETTREVLFTMLLRLLEYPEVIDLLVLVLNESKYCNDNLEKWLRWSRQSVETLLPMLRMNKIRTDQKGALVSMKRFILVLNHQAFMPLQNVLIVLFENPLKHESSLTCVNRCLGKVITLLLMVSHIKEDVLLSEIVEIQEEFSPHSVFRSAIITSDPLNVTNTTEIFSGVPPEVIFVKFLFRVIEIVSNSCVEVVKSGKENYLINQFSDFLIFCLHMLQSGSHCKITHTATNMFSENGLSDFNADNERIPVEEINLNFLYLSSFYPNVTFYWCYLLALLSYNNRKFWAKVMQVTDCYGIIEQMKSTAPEDSKCITAAIVRVGGVITFCDYLSENMLDGEQLSWFLVNTIESLVDLNNEPPVFEFVTSLHRNPSASSLVIQAVAAKCLNKSEPSFNVKILKTIENAHSSQIGSVLKLLLPKLLDSRQLAISRLVANVASRKVELLLTMSVEEVNAQFPREDFNHIMDLMVKTKLARKHETLVALLNKLATRFYDSSPLEMEQRRTINPEYIKQLQVNKNWFITQIKHNCYSSSLSIEMAELLSHIDHEDLLNLMGKKDFNKTVLKESIKVSVNKIKQENSKDEPVLFKVAVSNVMEIVRHIRSFVPKPHQVYRVLDREPSPSELKYSNKLTEIFSDEFVWSFLNETIPCVTCYIESFPSHPLTKIPDNYFEDFIKFAVICLESVNFTLDVYKCKLMKYIVDALNCADVICKEVHLCGILGLDTHVSWLCSAVNSIYKIVSRLLSDNSSLPVVSKSSLKSTLENVETMSAGFCCYQLSLLVIWLEKNCDTTNIPKYFLGPIKSLVVSLARLPLVNSYILTPPSAWKCGFSVELSGIFATLVPQLPIEYLKEVDILEEFIFRFSLIGWTSRQQFEETWMSLLSVLNSISAEDSFAEEANETRSMSIAIKAITSLLLQTLYTPVIGNPNVSTTLHVPRNKPFDTSLESVYRLKNVQNKLVNQFKEYADRHNINNKLLNVFSMSNLEKINSSYSYGQLSVEYLMIASNIAESMNKNNYVTQVYKTRKKYLEDSGLDVNSCLQFLLDHYSQWLTTEGTNIRILHEVVQSTLMISDLFTDKAQFEWMLDSFLTLSKIHTPEDEVLHQYVVVGCCKAAAVLSTDLETYEALKKLIVQNLKSTFTPCRTAALHGILYLLQGNILGSTHIGTLSDEIQLILPIITDYVQCHTPLKTDVLSQSLEHTLTTWALAFYIIENLEENNLDPQFTSSVLQSASLVLQSKVSTHLQLTILKGLERLIIKKCLSNQYIDLIMKIAIENIKTKTFPLDLCAIQLLLSCTYTNSLKKKGNELEDNPDNLVHLLEKVSIIFDHIKKGFPFQVQILCSILPDILNYFFTPADILTKVLGEFLSQQQPHPKLLSSVVFKVFENSINQSQLPLLQDWVVFSLSNFTNSFSMSMATWYLSCFFVSASTNPWLRSFFPYIQARIGRFEYEDRKLLCIAGADFYKNLTNDKQRQTFIDSFDKVKDQIDSPFKDLLASVES